MNRTFLTSTRCFRYSSLDRPCRTVFTAAEAFSPKAIQKATSDPHFPIVISEDGTHALRKRSDGNKPLPLPPHMDPVRRAQRNRWKDPKKREYQIGELTEFQKKIRENPFAHALASPVRKDRLTEARLPSFFLCSFAPAPVPQSISENEDKTSRTPYSMLPIDLFDEFKRGDDHLQKDTISHVKRRVYYNLHQATLERLTQKRTVRYMPDEGMDKILRGVNAREKLQWRQDMGEFVLQMLRSIVHRDLMRLIKHAVPPELGRLEVLEEPEPVPDDIAFSPAGVSGLHEIDNAACVLYFTRLKSPELAQAQQELSEIEAKVDSIVEKHTNYLRKGGKLGPLPRSTALGAQVPRLNPAIRKPPLDFPSAEYHGKRVPVYGMVELMGEREIREILSSSRFDHARCLVIKEGVKTLQLQSSLLKLQNYLAEA